MSNVVTNTTKPRVVFIGSGPVAAKSLHLLQQHTEVEAVITKPVTRLEMLVVAPKTPQFLVSNKAELDNLIRNQNFTSPVGVLIDFGIIISQQVIDSFPSGIVNSHFSLLPEWRGPDPITFSILSGQAGTGVSLMLLVQKMDEGPILAYGEQPLDGKETTPLLTDRLIQLSDSLLRAELPRYLSGVAKPLDQMIANDKFIHRSVSYSRKLKKEDGKLDWEKPAAQIEREIRAFTGWPKSYCTLAGKDVVITSAEVAQRTGEPGEIIVDNRELYICCKEASIKVVTIKPAGKADMPAAAFLNGYGTNL